VLGDERQRGVLLAGEERVVVNAGGDLDRRLAGEPVCQRGDAGVERSSLPGAILTGMPVGAGACAITSSVAKSRADANAPVLAARASA
jgi:hypothetical protein